jgi:hypothetical protein
VTGPVSDPVAVAVASDLGDRRLQLADVVVLGVQPTAPAAAHLAVDALHRLPGCALVAAAVAAGGCVLCSRDAGWLVVRTGCWTTAAVVRLAVGYHGVCVTAHRPSSRDRRCATSSAQGLPRPT